MAAAGGGLLRDRCLSASWLLTLTQVFNGCLRSWRMHCGCLCMLASGVASRRCEGNAATQDKTHLLLKSPKPLYRHRDA